MSDTRTDKNRNDPNKKVSLEEFQATVPKMEKLLLETATWKASEIDLVEARRILCKPAFIILKGQVTHGRDYKRTAALDTWLDYCKENSRIFIDQDLELDLSLFRRDAFHATYRAAGVTISQDTIAADPSQTNDAGERTRVEADRQGSLTNSTSLINPVNKAPGAKGSKVNVSDGAAKDGAIANTSSIARVVNAPRVTTPVNAPGYTVAPNTPKTAGMIGAGASGKVESHGSDSDEDGSNRDMEIDSNGERGRMDIELLSETDAEGETEESGAEESGTEVTDDGAGDEGDEDHGLDEEVGESDGVTEDGADIFSAGLSTNKRERTNSVEERAQDFEEGYDRQELKRWKLYNSPKKNLKKVRGIVRAGPGNEVNTIECELCEGKPGQVCFKQDPNVLTRPALCCGPCRTKGKKCSFNTAAKRGASHVSDSRGDEDSASEEGKDVGGVDAGQEGQVQKALSSGDEQGELSSADEQAESRGSAGARQLASGARVTLESESMRVDDGERETAKAEQRERITRTKKGGKVEGGYEARGGQNRLKAVDDKIGDTATQDLDVDNGVENGNAVGGAAKKGRAHTARSVQPARGTTVWAASRPKVNPSSNAEPTQGSDTVATSHRTKRRPSNKTPLDEALDGNGAERRSAQAAGQSNRARPTTIGPSAIARGKQPEPVSAANEMAVDIDRTRATSTFRRVAPGGVDDVTPGTVSEALAQLTDDHVALEQRVTEVDGGLRVSNRRVTHLEEQLQATNGAVAGLATAQSQDRGAYHHQLRTLEEKIDKQQDSIRVNNAFIETVSQRVNTLEAHHNTRLNAVEGQLATTIHPPAPVIAPALLGVPDIIGTLAAMLEEHRIAVSADVTTAIAKLEKLLTDALAYPRTGTQALEPLLTGVPGAPLHAVSAWQETAPPPPPIAPTGGETGEGRSVSAPLQAYPKSHEPYSHPLATPIPGAFSNMAPSRTPVDHHGSTNSNLGIQGARGAANTSRLGHHQVHQGAGLQTTLPAQPASVQANSVRVPSSNQHLPHPAQVPYHPNSHPSVNNPSRNPGTQDLHAPSMFASSRQPSGGVLSAVGPTAPIINNQGTAPTHSGYVRVPHSAHQQPPLSVNTAHAYDTGVIAFNGPHGGSVQVGYGQPQENVPYPPPSTDHPSNGEGGDVGEEDGEIPIDNYAEFGGIPPGGMTAYLQAPLPETTSSVSRRSAAHRDGRRQGGSTAHHTSSNAPSASTTSQATNQAVYGSAAPRPSALTSVGGISVGWSNPGSPLTEVPSSNMGSMGPPNASSN